MAPAPRDTYFENEVLTASPQKLRLMLIEAAIRLGNQTLEHWREGRESQALDSILRCQRILAEMLKGLRPEIMPELVSQVNRVYRFIYRNLVLAQAQRDPVKLTDALRVLEIERETWRKVCEQLGSKQTAAQAIPAPHGAASRFSIEA
jgi:flagellar secretion chaperone FliS